MTKNKPKIILFDIDGVLIRPPHYYWAELENKGYKNVETAVSPFFKDGDMEKCLEGKADSLELLPDYLKKFGWEKSAFECLQEWFKFEAAFLDQDLIAIIENIKKQNILCALATDQEKHRTKYLLEELDFQNIFTKHYISSLIGCRKGNKKFWRFVLSDLKKDFKDLSENEIAYFDDQQSNLDVAKKFNIQTFLFTDLKQFKTDLKILNIR
jgi:putative hydrolase of the HAD superfamily